jgi:GAF domain-containing protein
MEALGLLAHEDVERLESLAQGLADVPVGSPEHDAWDQELSAGLSAFAAAGGDSHPRQVHTALVAWLLHAARAPETTEGLHDVLTALRKVVPFGGATLCVRDPDRREVRTLATVGFPVELIGRIRFQEGMGFSSWVAMGKKPILYPSLHRNEAPDPDRVRSFMAVPLVLGNECLGVLSLGHAQDGAYDQGSLRRLLLAGGILAGLVQRFVAHRQIATREIRDRETGLLTTTYLRRRLDEEVLRSR